MPAKMLKAFLILCVGAALRPGALAGPSPAPPQRPVLVAQEPSGLEDRPASKEAAPSGAAEKAKTEKASPAEKGGLKQALLDMFKSAAFWALLAATLAAAYVIAWAIAQVGFQRSRPLSAIGAARVGAGLGLLLAPAVPFAYVWRTQQPWLWAIALAIPFVACSLVILLSRPDAA